MSELPSSAKIVIVGGGIVGCSVAYHLGKMGITDTLLIELRALTIRKKAEPGHLTLSAPANATVEPLDPREMLGRESR